jgi:hypothetical protein
VKAFLILNIFPLFLIMDSAKDKFNYAKIKIVYETFGRKKSTIVLNLNITSPVRRNNLVEHIFFARSIAATFVLVVLEFAKKNESAPINRRVVYIPSEDIYPVEDSV